MSRNVPTLRGVTLQMFMYINISVILIGDVNTSDHHVTVGGMKGCQVSTWFVGNRGIKMSQIFQGMSTSEG